MIAWWWIPLLILGGAVAGLVLAHFALKSAFRLPW